MTQKQRTRLGNAAFYIGNTLVALIFVSPLIWMISSSLKPEAGIFKGLNSLGTFIPKGASLSNYLEVFVLRLCHRGAGSVYQLHLRLCAGKV